jgi:hypothetical protein
MKIFVSRGGGGIKSNQSRGEEKDFLAVEHKMDSLGDCHMSKNQFSINGNRFYALDVSFECGIM